jgi:hypothetical protein
MQRRVRLVFDTRRKDGCATEQCGPVATQRPLPHIPAVTTNKLDAVRQGLRRAKELANTARDIAKATAQSAVREAAVQSDRLTTVPKGGSSALESPPPEPPVVARLMVEIRSDGSRTIARGAIQDELTGEQVAIEAKGNSPLELAGQLAKSLVTTPLGLGLATLSRTLPNKRRKHDD